MSTLYEAIAGCGEEMSRMKQTRSRLLQKEDTMTHYDESPVGCCGMDEYLKGEKFF